MDIDVSQPRMLTRLALIHLDEAVLEVMFKARDKNYLFLQPTQISSLLGILTAKEIKGPDYPIVHGILERLASKGLVRPEPAKSRSPWTLTEKAIESLRAQYETDT